MTPPRRQPPPAPTLSIFPDQLHIGDRFTDAETGDEPHEWEVASRPVTFKKGHEVRARVQRSEAIWTEILTESKMLGGIELRRRALRSQGFDV